MDSELINELRDRMPELELYAEQHGVTAYPSQFPRGLFKARGPEWALYVKEVAQDIQRLALAERPASQRYLAQIIQQKINVLTMAAKRQLHRKIPAKVNHKKLLTRQSQSEMLTSQLRHNKEALLCLERTLSRAHTTNPSALLNTLKNLQAKITQQTTALKKLHSLLSWLSDT